MRNAVFSLTAWFGEGMDHLKGATIPFFQWQPGWFFRVNLKKSAT